MTIKWRVQSQFDVNEKHDLIEKFPLNIYYIIYKQQTITIDVVHHREVKNQVTCAGLVRRFKELIDGHRHQALIDQLEHEWGP